MANQDRMTIYMNEQDKVAVETLKTELLKRGLKMSNPKKKFGVSELFRYLVQKELNEVKK